MNIGLPRISPFVQLVKIMVIRIDAALGDKRAGGIFRGNLWDGGIF